ncbi:probable ATP-dependent RNA helicase DDX49 [Octopus sinensis]|uniref:RNA helicase n=1 Tax=Octopus sinensis TaxID=2607531 RepID=A0A7E6EHK5_9MOLL|nr:probable ATP-dependent RNA helicase DDX49 [Octopus sinensis]
MNKQKSFKKLGICEWIVNHCDSIGVRKPSPVQSACIPEILSGKDVLACAKTGSGKTAAFALPIIQILEKDPYGIFALVLTASRELASQICDQFCLIGRPIHLKTVYYVEQLTALSELPHVVVATPGRLSDLLEYKSGDLAQSLSQLRFLVLDEADRLLEGDFETQLSSIISFLPTKNRQTLMFSATDSPILNKLTESSNPFKYKEETTTVDLLDQRFVLMEADKKDSYLLVLLDAFLRENPSSSIIVFTNQCK